MSVDSATLLSWCQRNTTGYPGVDVDSFGECWRDGLAFCALIHKFHPEKIDFPSLNSSNKLENLQLAFKIGKQLGISRSIDANSLLESSSLDSDAIINYLSHYYNTFHITQLMNYSRAALLSDSLSSASLLDKANSSSSLTHSLSTSPSLSHSQSNLSPSPLSISLTESPPSSPLPVIEKALSVSFIPTTPTEESQRSPSPFRIKKDTADGKKEEKSKSKPKEKEKKVKPKEKEKDTKSKTKTTSSPKTPTKSPKTEAKDKKEKTKTDKTDKAAKLQRPPSNLKMRKSPSTVIAPPTPTPSKTPRTARSVSAPPARPPSATPGKTPRKENKTPRTPATPTPRNSSPRKSTPKDKEKSTKSSSNKKDRPTTPSAKSHHLSDSVMSDATSDRIRTLEIENSQLKAKLNEYKSLCESLEVRLNNEMEIRKKVVQQLQGFKVPED